MKCIVEEGVVRSEGGVLKIKDHVITPNTRRDDGSILIWALLGEHLQLYGIRERDIIEQCIFEAAYGDIRNIGIAVFGAGFNSAARGANHKNQIKRRKGISSGVFNCIFKRIRKRMVSGLPEHFEENEERIRPLAIRAIHGCSTIQEIRYMMGMFREECNKLSNDFMNEKFDEIFDAELALAIRNEKVSG